MRSNRRHRSNQGSMLLMTIMAMFLIILVMVQLSGFLAVCIAHEHLQDQAERFEISAVQVLNESDRAGRMNLMTAASRELVFDSRQVYNGVAQRSPAYMPLAEFYLNQSRNSAELMADERKKLVGCTLTRLRELSNEFDQNAGDQNILPGASTKGALIYNLDLGYNEHEDSNVWATPGDQLLFEYDKEYKYFDRQTMLYHANTTLKLPGPDADLDFTLSHLPAPIAGTVAQARIDEGCEFVPMVQMIRDGQQLPDDCKYLPSRARLTFVNDFHSALWLSVSSRQRIAATVCGTTNGGGRPAI